MAELGGSGILTHLYPEKEFAKKLKNDVMTHIYLGNWEIAAATIRTMKKKGYGDMSDVLEKIIRNPSGVSRGSEMLPSVYHLAWLANNLLEELQGKPSPYGPECDLNLLLYRLRDSFSSDSVKKLQCLCLPWKDLHHTSHELLTDLKPHFIRLLDDNVNPLKELTPFLKQFCGESIIDEIHALIVDYANVVLERNEIVYENKTANFQTQKCTETGKENRRIYEVLWLIGQFDLGHNEKKMAQLFSKLEFLDQISVYSALLGAEGVVTLEAYLKYLDEKRHIMAIIRTDGPEFWRELCLYCVKNDKDLMQVIVDASLDLMRDGHYEVLLQLVTRPWIEPLKPLLLLMGWKYCTDCDKAVKLIDILFDEETRCDPLISKACRKRIYQVKLVIWCLEKTRSLAVASVTTESRIAAVLRNSDMDSPLAILKELTDLSSLDRNEVLDLLRKYTNEIEDKPFGEESHETCADDEQNCDIAVYRAFTALREFIDALLNSERLDAMIQSENSSQKEIQSFYEENIWKRICLGKTLLSELSSLTYRLEILENIYNLLYTEKTSSMVESGLESDESVMSAVSVTRIEASNHSTPGNVREVGTARDFLACDYYVRDVLHVLKECLLDFDRELFQLREVPRKVQPACPSLIPVSEMSSRLSHLRHLVSEASWRYSLVVSSDCKPGTLDLGNEQDADDDSDVIMDFLKTHVECTSAGSSLHSETTDTDSACKTSRQSVLVRMMAPPPKLIDLCLKQSKYAQARTVIKMYNMEHTEWASDVDLAEIFHSTSHQIRAMDRKSFMGPNNASAKAVLSLVEDVFKTNEVLQSHPKTQPLLALDFALTVCKTLDSGLKLMELGRNLLHRNEVAEQHLAPVIDEMLDVFRQVNDINCPNLQHLKTAPSELLKRPLVPLCSEECRRYLNKLIAFDSAFRRIALSLEEMRNEEKQSVIIQFRGGGKQDLKKNPRFVHYVFKQLVKVLSEDIPNNGIAGYFVNTGLNGDSPKPFRNYLGALYDHVKILSSLTFDKTNTEPVGDDYFKMLEYSLSDIMAKLLFEKRVPPCKLEKPALKLNVDLVKVIIMKCCPKIRAGKNTVTEETKWKLVSGKILLNGDECESTCQKRPDVLVAEILTKLVKLMKRKVMSLHSGTSVTCQHAHSMLDDGDVIEVLAQSRHLRNCDVTLLTTTNEKVSFYCNLVNLLNVHTSFYCLQYGHKQFNRIHKLTMFGYQVGQLGVLSQIELRYQIMRADLPPANAYGGLLKPGIAKMDQSDTWYWFAPPPEPRLLFTCVDGSLGSPSLRVLSTELVQQQLQQAMADYLQNAVFIDEESRKVAIPELLLWYGSDFVEDINEKDYKSLINFIAAHTTEIEGEKLRQLLNFKQEINGNSEGGKEFSKLPFEVEITPFENDFGYRLDYLPIIKTHRRGSSLPLGLEKSLERTLSVSATSPQRTYNMRAEALQYIKTKDPLLATIVSMVCSDDFDDIEDGFNADFYHYSCGNASPGGHGREKRPSPGDISLVDVRSYRYQRLQNDYPYLKNYLVHQVIPLVGSDAAESPDPILKFVSNPINRHIRQMMFSSPYSDRFRNSVQKTLDKLMEKRKYRQMFRVVENIPEPILELNPQFEGYKDWALCCAAFDESLKDPEKWRFLLRMKNRAAMTRIVVGSLDNWDIYACVELLQYCALATDLDADLQKMVNEKFETMKVYKKIVECALRLRESTGHSSDPLLSQLSADWRSIVKLTPCYPSDVVWPLLQYHEYASARRWALVHEIPVDVQMFIEESHIIHLLEQGEENLDDAHVEFESYMAKSADFCLGIGDHILNSCNDENVIIFVCEFLLDRLDRSLSAERKEELHLMCIGAKALQEFTKCTRPDYCHLVSKPLLMIEQLLMNKKADLVEKTLAIVKRGVQSAGDVVRHFELSLLDELVVTYATRAIEFPYLLCSGLDESFAFRSQSRMSQYPAEERLAAVAAAAERSQSRMSHVASDDRRRRRSTFSLNDTVDHSDVPSVNSTFTSLPSYSRSSQIGVSIDGAAGNGHFVMPLSPVPREKWVPDMDVTMCMCCNNVRFSMFNRRHHCRRCGRVVCGACSTKRTRIHGQKQRTCTDCYNQTFRSGYAIKQESLHTRLLSKLSGGSNTADTSSTDSSGSPPQGGQYEELPQYGSNNSTTEFTWKLSLDENMNAITREDFYFENSPCVELCLTFMELCENVHECSKQMLLFCDELSKLLKFVPGHTTRNMDYSLVISMMKHLLFHAKIKFERCGDAMGMTRCDQYLSRIDLLQLLVDNNCPGIPSIDELTKLDTVGRMRDRLIAEERYLLAVDVSTKCGLDAGAVWSSWGLACLIVNDLPKARTMFTKCLKPPVDANQMIPNKILNDILETIENRIVRVEERLSPEPRHKYLDEERFAECLYYLKAYGTHVALVNFYRKHGYWQKAAKYILDKKCCSEVFIEGMLMPALENYDFRVLEDQLTIIDPTLDVWYSHLTAACRHLQRLRQSDALYDVQVFMKDHIRAAMSCIHVFYLGNAQTYADLRARAEHLTQAREHLETYLHKDRHGTWTPPSVARASSPNPDWAVRNPLADRAEKMPAKAVQKHMKTISLQMEVDQLLDGIDIAHINDDGAEDAVYESAPSGVRRLATLFGNNKTRGEVAVTVMAVAPDAERNFLLGCRIIRDYKLSASFVFSQVVRRLAKTSQFTPIRHFLSLVMDSQLCSDQDFDEIVCACVRVIADRPHEAKEADNLIKLIKLESNRINANILCGKLKQAYLIAVKRGSIEDVQMIARTAQRTGQAAVKDICDRFLAQMSNTSLD